MKKATASSPQSAPGRSLVDPRRLSACALEDVLGIGSSTRKRWVAAGCPVGDDGTYDSGAVHRWALSRAEHRGSRTDESGELDRLRGERMKRDISLKDLDIQEKLAETMPRSEHVTALRLRAERWQALVRQIPAQGVHFIGLADLKSAQDKLHELCVSFADVWRLTPEELEQQKQQTKEVENV